MPDITVGNLTKVMVEEAAPEDTLDTMKDMKG